MEEETPRSLDNDARNRRLLETLLSWGLCVRPVLNEHGLCVELRVSTSLYQGQDQG